MITANWKASMDYGEHLFLAGLIHTEKGELCHPTQVQAVSLTGFGVCCPPLSVPDHLSVFAMLRHTT